MAKKKVHGYAREFADADYLDKLSPQDKQWYEQFSDEYYNQSSHSEKSIHSKEQLKENYTSLNKAKADYYSNATRSKTNIDDIDTQKEDKSSIRYRLKVLGKKKTLEILYEEMIDEVVSLLPSKKEKQKEFIARAFKNLFEQIREVEAISKNMDVLRRHAKKRPDLKS